MPGPTGHGPWQDGVGHGLEERDQRVVHEIDGIGEQTDGFGCAVDKERAPSERRQQQEAHHHRPQPPFHEVPGRVLEVDPQLPNRHAASEPESERPEGAQQDQVRPSPRSREEPFPDVRKACRCRS